MRILFAAATMAILLSSPAIAFAQSAGKCPDLHASSGLAWQAIQTDTLLFCRAVRADGSEGNFIRSDQPDMLIPAWEIFSW